jgi:hypothetical protein
MIFFSFVSQKKHFLKKMLGQVLVKKSSFWGATLNLHRGKTVKFFFTLFQVSMIPMAKISQTKKNRALYLACVLRYTSAKIRSFLKNGLYFGRPLYIGARRPGNLIYKINLHQQVWCVRVYKIVLY